MARPVRLIVCINERLGTGQRSCVGSGSLALIEQLEAMIVGAGLDVPVVRRECLGRCEEGPVMRFAPAGPFFTEIDAAALEEMFTQLKTFAARHAG
jgi:(2Fe-2S) ferredoxin